MPESTRVDLQAPRQRVAERMGGVGAVLSVQLERARRAGEAARTVILVEGVSDQCAIETLARRRDRDLDAEGVVILPIAGATNARRFLRLLGPDGYDVRLAGLCDRGEARLFRQALDETGLWPDSPPGDTGWAGLFVCERDLEDELHRALGVSAVLAIIEAQGVTRSFRSFQNQLAQRGKAIDRQLWRWMGNRKIRYAPLLVEALDLEHVPSPLDGLLSRL